MLPFEDLKVIDFTHVIAGPFCAYQLAVLGADVIKIESVHEPDAVREDGVDAAAIAAGMGSVFKAQSAGKRAIALDLKSDRGQAIALQLVRDADVVIENYRSGALAALGLGYDDVAAINPRVVYCSLTGFGQTGPKAEHTAYDNVIQAFSGLMAATGSHSTGPVKVGPPVLDYGTGAQAAFAIAAALYRRAQTGVGDCIDIAMLDAALMLMSANVTHYHAADELVAVSGNSSPKRSGYGCYETADGLLMIGAYTIAQHVALWRVIGNPQRADELVGAPMSEIYTNRDRDADEIQRRLVAKTAQQWEDLLNAAKVPAARVRNLDEALEHEQIASRTVLQSIAETGEGGSLPVAAFSYRTDTPKADRAPPRHGQHTGEILQELGYSEGEIDALVKLQVVARA